MEIKGLEQKGGNKSVRTLSGIYSRLERSCRSLPIQKAGSKHVDHISISDPRIKSLMSPPRSQIPLKPLDPIESTRI